MSAVQFKEKRSLSSYFDTAFIYATLAFCSIVLLFPLFWMITTSLKTPQQSLNYPPQWWPSSFNWRNYSDLFAALPFGRFILNSIIITALATVGTVMSSSIVAFAFARMRAPGKRILFIVVLATLMLPGSVILVPTFVIFKYLHWIDTFLPLIVPRFFGNAFFIFLLRQFYMSIPFELDEAALIDGAGWLTIYRLILLPLSRPALATVAVLTIVANWTDFFGPLLYLNSIDHLTLAVGLTFLVGTQGGGSNNNLVLEMAGATISTMPLIVLFFIAQRVFIKGITLSVSKG